MFQGETRSDAFRKLNPVGAVPVLELEDGRTIAESSAILIYLADGTRYLPGDRYARAFTPTRTGLRIAVSVSSPIRGSRRGSSE